MAKIVAYDTLIPEIAGIQPNIAWLLANVTGSDRITEVLEDLQLKYARLQGKILELESGVVELEEGTVTVTLPEEETDDDLAYVEEALRTTLAETIVQRGEEQLERERLEKNKRFAQIYGGDFTKLLQGPSCHVVHDVVFLDFELDPGSVERFQGAIHNLGYWSVQDAIEQARTDHEEAEALGTALAAVGAYGELTNECLKSGGKCDSLQCDGCDPPDIDMDGQPFN